MKKAGESIFSQILNEQIEAKGISQKFLASKIGVTQQTISNYVQGVSYPDYRTLLAIADYFGLSVDYFLNGFQNNTDLLPDFVNSAGIPLADDIMRYIKRPSAFGFVSLDDKGNMKITEYETECSQSLDECLDKLAFDKIAKDLELLRGIYLKQEN